MNKLFFKVFFLVFLISIGYLFSAQGLVKDPIYDDLEGFDLVFALLKDGKLDLARKELDRDTLKNENSYKYYWMMGLWHSAKNAFPKAIDEYEKALRIKDTDEVRLSLARAYHQDKKYSDCEKTFLSFKSVDLFTESDFLFKSFCEYKSNHWQNAWSTLQMARAKYASYSVERDAIVLFLELKMNHEAFAMALSWLKNYSSQALQFLNMAELFHNVHQDDFALSILELARLRYPTNMDINLSLSQLFFQKQLLRSSEEGFARASLTDHKYYYHAAELSRQNGNYERSMYFNSFVVDEKERLKQKIASYVDTNKYGMIASLDSVIQRSELRDDDEVRYALAYSLVRVGQMERSLAYLAKIKRPELIEKTTVLRKALLDCQEKKQSCKI